MEVTVPTITETKEEIIIRIPKGWRRFGGARSGVKEILRIVREGEREFRAGSTRTFEDFLMLKKYT